MNAPAEKFEIRLVSREAEQFVIGALLIDNDAIDRIGDLKPEHFYIHEHRTIFTTILRIVMQHKPADVLTVSDALKCAGSDAGDLVYLNSLQNNTPSSANIARYADIVRDRAIKRGLVALGREIEEMAESSSDDSHALVDRITSKVEVLAQARTKNEPLMARESLAVHIESIDERYHGNGPKAIPTGFDDIDEKLNGGMRRGEVIVVAARPKMGKSAFALNVANHVAVDYSSLVLSLEMPKSQLHDRNLASLGNIPLPHLLNPKKMADQDWSGLTRAVQKLNDMSLWMDDQGALTLMDVRAKAKQVKRRGGLDLLVVDYLQLMEAEGDNRNAQIESITRGIKALAKELDMAVMLLSQLNRELERRPNKRPVPSDLRDSGSIEQDADVVIFLYRDEVYNPDSQDKGICEANIALNRQGASGVVPLVYIGEQTRFENMRRAWSPPLPRMPATRSMGFPDD
jgi:replicative DNA helicase